MEINKIIRLNVINLRNEKGWTQDELAIQMNKTRSWITHIESGRTKVIKPEHIEQLAKVFNITPSFLISNNNEKNVQKLEVIIEESWDDEYWITVKDKEDNWYMGDGIDLLIQDKKIRYREIALKNGAELNWNDQTAEYEFNFKKEEAAIKTKEYLKGLFLK